MEFDLIYGAYLHSVCKIAMSLLILWTWKHFASMHIVFSTTSELSAGSFSKGLDPVLPWKTFAAPPDTLFPRPHDLWNLKQVHSACSPCASTILHIVVSQHFVRLLAWCTPCTGIPQEYSTTLLLYSPWKCVSSPLATSAQALLDDLSRVFDNYASVFSFDTFLLTDIETELSCALLALARCPPGGVST